MKKRGRKTRSGERRNSKGATDKGREKATREQVTGELTALAQAHSGKVGVSTLSQMRKVFLKAFESLGGLTGLVKWANECAENKTTFYKMLASMIPRETQITGGDKPISIIVKTAVPRPPMLHGSTRELPDAVPQFEQLPIRTTENFKRAYRRRKAVRTKVVKKVAGQPYDAAIVGS